MNVNLSSILIVVSIFAIVGGFLGWILSLFLTDKKDKMTLAFEVEKIKEDINELKEGRDIILTIKNKLDIIEEKIKHL